METKLYASFSGKLCMDWTTMHFSQTNWNVLSYYTSYWYEFLPTTDQGKHQHSSPFELMLGSKALPIDSYWHAKLEEVAIAI